MKQLPLPGMISVAVAGQPEGAAAGWPGRDLELGISCRISDIERKVKVVRTGFRCLCLHMKLKIEQKVAANSGWEATTSNLFVFLGMKKRQ